MRQWRTVKTVDESKSKKSNVEGEPTESSARLSNRRIRSSTVVLLILFSIPWLLVSIPAPFGYPVTYGLASGGELRQISVPKRPRFPQWLWEKYGYDYGDSRWRGYNFANATSLRLPGRQRGSLAR